MLQKELNYSILDFKRKSISITHALDDLIDRVAGDIPSGFITQEIENDDAMFQEIKKFGLS